MDWILKIFYLLQNLGARIIKNAKNSNLPKTIPNDNSNFRIEGKLLKLSSGPMMFPRPGPTTEIEVRAAETDVIKSYS